MKLQIGNNAVHGTSIDDIDVPEQLRKRRFTGMRWFDEATSGLVPSNVMMLTGDAGAGKTTLALQLASELSKEHVVLYNTGEESLYQVKMVAERLKLTGTFSIGNDTLVSEVLKHADKLQARDPRADNNSGKQVFIIQDSLPTLDDGHYKNGTTSKTPLRCCELLTNWAKTTYGIVIFVNHVTKGGQFIGKNTLKHMIDAHARLYIEQDKRSDVFGERVFLLDKNRFGSSGSARVVGLNETGIFEKFVVHNSDNEDEQEITPPKETNQTRQSGVFNVNIPSNLNEGIKIPRRIIKH